MIRKVGSAFQRYFKFHYQYENKESIILRDFLALERTRLANERTLLAYVKAALYLLLGGIALIQIKGFADLSWLGYVAIGLSVLFVAIGIHRYFRLKHQLHEFYHNEGKTKDSKPVKKEVSQKMNV